MRSSRYTYALIAFAASLVSSIASAQSPRFGVLPVDPSLVPNVKDVIAHGINRRGEVVGEITFTGNSETHAFLFLLTGRAGLSAGMHDLHELAELSQSHSVAHDINDFMQIVGESDGVAHIWDMVGYPTQHENWFRTLGTLGGATSVAYDISTAYTGEDPQIPTPVIVGESATSSNCSISNPVCAGFAIE